jgi:hypothetical protein
MEKSGQNWLTGKTVSTPGKGLVPKPQRLVLIRRSSPGRVGHIQECGVCNAAIFLSEEVARG